MLRRTGGGVDDLHRAGLGELERGRRVDGGEGAVGGLRSGEGHAVGIDGDAREGELLPADEILPGRCRGVMGGACPGGLDAVPEGDEAVLDVAGDGRRVNVRANHAQTDAESHRRGEFPSLHVLCLS